jgi:hypothetical protein
MTASEKSEHNIAAHGQQAARGTRAAYGVIVLLLLQIATGQTSGHGLFANRPGILFCSVLSTALWSRVGQSATSRVLAVAPSG